ncbi:MAG TPA: YihA family ribosome biogenesis GTP-binding protein [Bacteroidetes bacterium]|nr:YihA family ribosome biogenesis GTP-binding protein [Bacteroidota bacterium]
MNFGKAKFFRSYSHVDQIKDSKTPEFAFIGRSNVGKSSLINAMTMKRDMAKTSAKPGKTQLINFFNIEHHLSLVDLPGYGYAKVSKKLREQFEGLITEYLIQSENLFIVFVLIDAAIPPQRIDLEFLEWCGSNKVPVGIVFTKTDKKKPKETEANMRAFEAQLDLYFEELPVTFETSASTKHGVETLGAWIAEQVGLE